MERRFVRFVGKLWESGEFEPAIGWETERIARRPRPDPDHRLQLVDDSGGVLVESAVELRVPTCRVQGADGMTSARVVGYLPLHPDGRAVLLLRGERVLHRAELATERPRITIVDAEVGDDGCVRAHWQAEHDRPLWFSLVLVDSRRRAIPVARELSESHIALETADLPGGPGCSLAVLATDGLRSAMARSHPFHLPEKSPRVAIVAPRDGEMLAPDEPISLLGHAHDLAGQSLPDEHLTWSVDEQVVARGRRLAPAGPLEPGDHRVELAYVQGSEVAVRAEVHLTVSERSPEQEEWLKVSTRRDQRRPEMFPST